MIVDARVQNLFFAQKLFVPIAHADLSPLLQLAAEALRHDLLHRSAREALAVIGLRVQPQIQRIRAHLQAVAGVLQFPSIGVVPAPVEVEAPVHEEVTENLRRGGCVRRLEDEAAAADAELQGVGRRIPIGGGGSPLDAEADDEAVSVEELAVEEERGGDPPIDDGGGGGDGDGSSVKVDVVDAVVGTALTMVDNGHFFSMKLTWIVVR